MTVVGWMDGHGSLDNEGLMDWKILVVHSGVKECRYSGAECGSSRNPGIFYATEFTEFITLVNLLELCVS